MHIKMCVVWYDDLYVMGRNPFMCLAAEESHIYAAVNSKYVWYIVLCGVIKKSIESIKIIKICGNNIGQYKAEDAKETR